MEVSRPDQRTRVETRSANSRSSNVLFLNSNSRLARVATFHDFSKSHMSRLMREATYSACVIALTMVALKHVIAQLRDNVEPLYGSVPSELWFEGVIKASIMVSAMDARSNMARTVCQLLIISAPVLLISPTIYHWSALYTARMGSPKYGPLMTHLMTFLPISYVLFVTPMVHVSRIGFLP
jgi:hypothetical protein